MEMENEYCYWKFFHFFYICIYYLLFIYYFLLTRFGWNYTEDNFNKTFFTGISRQKGWCSPLIGMWKSTDNLSHLLNCDVVILLRIVFSVGVIGNRFIFWRKFTQLVSVTAKTLPFVQRHAIEVFVYCDFRRFFNHRKPKFVYFSV